MYGGKLEHYASPFIDYTIQFDELIEELLDISSIISNSKSIKSIETNIAFDEIESKTELIERFKSEYIYSNLKIKIIIFWNI